MRTIAFYSYKGGNGKSLLAANLAVCLSRLGKSCVVVDWDIDAPSAHFKLGVSQAPGGGGLVRLIRDCLKQLEDNHFHDLGLDEVQLLDDKGKLRINDVERYVYELDDVRERSEQIKGGPAGRIYLLPAGDTRKDFYWNTTWSRVWREMFTIDYVAEKRPEQKNLDLRDRVFKFLQAIKSELGKLPGEPEYLLVDCRSGSSDLTMTLSGAWLEDPITDRFVYCLTFNKESIGYLDRFSRTVDPRLYGMIVPVLGRVPTSFEFLAGNEELREALERLGKKTDSLLTLHSDRNLEGHEEIRLGLNLPIKRTRLTSEYLLVFQELIDSSLWSGDTLANKLGLPDKGITEMQRIFDLNEDTGALVNPNDESRNVSFKAETFQLFLVGLEAGLGTAPGIKEQLPRLLSAAGEQCGARFGKVMLARFATEDDLGGIQRRLEKWCTFDSDVGFGKFELVRKSIKMEGGTLVAVDILLRQSFLTPADDTKPIFDEDTKTFNTLQDHRFCTFIQGYVRGVLVQLLNDKDLVVGHEEIGRGTGEQSDSCIFTLRQSASQTVQSD